LTLTERFETVGTAQDRIILARECFARPPAPFGGLLVLDKSNGGRQLSKRAAVKAAIVAIACLAAVAVSAPANAGTFEQYWPWEEDYRASYDFIPNTGTITPGGLACAGGLADHYRIQVVRTSNSSTHWASGNRETDSSNWHNNHGTVGVQAGTAYYMRFKSYTWVFWGVSEIGNPAPCQGLRATW
jgi:hypothetical protein